MPPWLYAIQVVLQAISSMAIAGGFLYAAVQFRHARRAAHVANFSKLVELQMQLRRMRVDDPSLAHVYAHDVEQLAGDADIREHFMNLMQLSLFEIAWFGHRHGQLPDDYFESWVRRMRSIIREESFRRMWSTRSVKILHDDFQRYVEELMVREGVPPPTPIVPGTPTVAAARMAPPPAPAGARPAP